MGTRNYNMQQNYQFKEKVGLYENFTEDIRSVLFTGIKRGVFTTAKFDSKEGELTLAWVLESDNDVPNWLRPPPREFNITYNRGHIYEPDFVVETEQIICLDSVVNKGGAKQQYSEFGRQRRRKRHFWRSV